MSLLSHIVVESAEGSTCLGLSGVDLVVDDNCAGKCTAKIREIFHYVNSLSADGDVGFNVGFPLSGLVQHLSLLGDCDCCCRRQRSCQRCVASPLWRQR